jgi:hypothetical protein
VGSLFIYQPPQFGFRPSEQRLLMVAREGGTDEELAEELGISLEPRPEALRLGLVLNSPRCGTRTLVGRRSTVEFLGVA